MLNMDLTGEIDIERRQLICSTQDIRKLSSPSGCQLNIVTDKVHKLCDVDEDDLDEDEVANNDSDLDDFHDRRQNRSSLDDKTRLSCMKREFVSLILNANRDPVKPGTRFKYKEYQEDMTAKGAFGLNAFNTDLSCVAIHRQYENIGNFENYMMKNKFQEVSPGRVFKLKRITGVQLPVTSDALVIYNCAFWTENSKEPYDSTWSRRTTITSHLETDSILPGLHELLVTCKQGELCEAFIRPEAAFGRLGVCPRIPPNATIFCLLEIVRVVSRDKWATMTMQDMKSGLEFDDLLEASNEARRRGNYFYEQHQYKIALLRYKTGIRLLECSTFKNETEEADANALLVKLFNNCARTANMLGNPRLALAACKQARLIDDTVSKTHWHRMTAWKIKGHPDKALGVARRAIQLFNQDPSTVHAFQKAADELKLKMQADQREVDDLHRLMGRALLTCS